MLTINEIRADTGDGMYRLSARINTDSSRKLEPMQQELFFALPEEYRNFIQADRADCFVLALLYFAMRRGEDIHVDGILSDQLLATLNSDVVPLLRVYRPALHKTHVTAANSKCFSGGDSTGTGFSGGVDSFYTILENRVSNYVAKNKVNVLFCFNAGTHGLADSPEQSQHTEAKFWQRFQTLTPAANQLGLPLIPVNSAIPSFLPDNILAAISLTNSAMIYFLSGKIRRYLLSSVGYNYQDLFEQYRLRHKHPLIDIETIEPILNGLLSLPELQISAAGNEKSRINKCRLIADNTAVQDHLNVCNSPSVIDRNCSICVKCRYTMADLEILGKLDNFRTVFDVNRFRRQFKSRDFAAILYPSSNDHFGLQTRDYAREQHIDLICSTSRMDRICARLNGSWLYHQLKKIGFLDAIKRIFKRKKHS